MPAAEGHSRFKPPAGVPAAHRLVHYVETSACRDCSCSPASAIHAFWCKQAQQRGTMSVCHAGGACERFCTSLTTCLICPLLGHGSCDTSSAGKLACAQIPTETPGPHLQGEGGVGQAGSAVVSQDGGQHCSTRGCRGVGSLLRQALLGDADALQWLHGHPQQCQH